MSVLKMFKGIVKNLKIGVLIAAANDAMSATQRDNINCEIELLLADSEAEKAEIRARFIERINKRNGFPTKSAAQQARENDVAKESKSSIVGDDFITPSTEAYKEVETKYSHPVTICEQSQSGKNNNGK